MQRFFIPKWPIGKGYTLVEALFTIAILGMVLVVMIPFIRTVHTSWNLGDRKTEIQQNARVGLEMMSRLLRQAKRITEIPTPGSVSFVKFRNALDDQTIIFFHNIQTTPPTNPYYLGNTGLIKDNDLVYRTISSSGVVTNSLLAQSLDTFSIDFKDASGVVTTLAYNVYSLDVSMTLSDPQGIIANTMNVFSTISVRPQVRITKPLWVTSGSNVVDVWRDVSIPGFSSPGCVSVNNTFLVNGRETVWVADTGNSAVKRLYWNNTTAAWVVETIPGTFSSPRSVSVNPNELLPNDTRRRETCWVADTGQDRIRRVVWTGSAWSYSSGGGMNLSMGNGSSPWSVCVNPNELLPASGSDRRNTCWVANSGIQKNNGYRVMKVYWNGSAYTFTANTTISMGAATAIPRSVSVNTTDGTCWVANSGNNSTYGNRILKLSCPSTGPGSILVTVSTNFTTPYAVSVDSSTGNCWAANTGNNSIPISRVSSAGGNRVNFLGFLSPQSVSAVSSEGSCWVADTSNDQVVKLDSVGNEEFRISGFSGPLSVAASP